MMDPFGWLELPSGADPNAMPRATLADQAGRVFNFPGTANTAVTLPDGGTWLHWSFGGLLGTGLLQSAPTMNISPGGTVVRPATLLVTWFGWAWRLS